MTVAVLRIRIRGIRIISLYLDPDPFKRLIAKPARKVARTVQEYLVACFLVMAVASVVKPVQS